jgi:hypothetical protein
LFSAWSTALRVGLTTDASLVVKSTPDSRSYNGVSKPLTLKFNFDANALFHPEINVAHRDLDEEDPVEVEPASLTCPAGRRHYW